MKRILLVFVLCLGLISLAQAQIQISGAQSGTLGPGDYLVVGDIQVPSGQTLTIVPGTTFMHNGGWSWMVYGRLNAEGTEADSIYFIRQNEIDDHRWRGIRFQNGSSDESTLAYCVIKNCYIPSNTSTSMPGGGIYCSSTDVTISHCIISECEDSWSGGGIYATYSNIVIEYCVIADCEALPSTNGGGIYLNYCSEPYITNNIIARNVSNGT